MSDKKAAQAALAAAVAKVHEAIAEAESIADDNGLTFNLDLAYGMGGTYVGTGIDGDDWRSSSAGSWLASSQSC